MRIRSIAIAAVAALALGLGWPAPAMAAAPTAVISLSNATLKYGETSTVTVTFTEPVIGFDATKLTVPNGAVSSGAFAGATLWTGVYTPSSDVESTSNQIHLDLAKITDAEGEPGVGVVSSQSFVVDTRPPRMQFATVSPDRISEKHSTRIEVAFSEPVTGVPSGAVSVPGATVGEFTLSGTSWIAFVTPLAGTGDATLPVTLDMSKVTDRAGNRGSGAVGLSQITVDRTPPTVAAITLELTRLLAGQTAQVTFVFSEAVWGFTAADLVVANGTVQNISSTDGGITWTGILTPDPHVRDETNVISLNLAGVTDAVGNPGLGVANSPNYAIDTVPLTAEVRTTIKGGGPILNIGGSMDIEIEFSEPVTGFELSDLSADGGRLSTLWSVDGGTTWNTTLEPYADVKLDDGRIKVNLGGVTTGTGSAGVGTASSSPYSVNTQLLDVNVSLSKYELRAGETATATFAFTEAVRDHWADQILVSGGTLSGLSTSDGGKVWTAILTPTANSVSPKNWVGLSLESVHGESGNPGSSRVRFSPIFSVNTVSPTAKVELSTNTVLAGETATATITFSEPVTGLTDAAITAGAGTLSGLVSTDGGKTWTATFTPETSRFADENEIRVNLDGVRGVSGNAVVGTAISPKYLVNTVRPSATVELSTDRVLAGKTATATITFSEPVTGFDVRAVTAGGGSLANLTSANRGMTWTGTFVPDADTVSIDNVLTVALDSVRGASGNTGEGSSTSPGYAVNTVRPTVDVELSSDTVLAGETASVTLTFSEAVTGLSDAAFARAARASAPLTAENGTLSAPDSSDGGVTWVATFTPTDDVVAADNVITVSLAGVRGVSGNHGEGTAVSASYGVDTVRPNATVELSSATLKRGDEAVVTAAFNVPITGLTAASFRAANAEVSEPSTRDGGRTWVAMLTPTLDVNAASNVLSIDLTGVTSLSGNAGIGSVTSASYSVDTVKTDGGVDPKPEPKPEPGDSGEKPNPSPEPAAKPTQPASPTDPQLVATGTEQVGALLAGSVAFLLGAGLLLGRQRKS
ncbi:hypothetical protein ACIFOC_02486 [Leucobacter aridicollis]|uniref:Ig-like domain-containing protein n=1 Tax=Leucobacter aridicollis TaxID=283878 RepID=UPI0037C618FA